MARMRVVNRMFGVYWHAIDADGVVESARFYKPFRRVMARLAQRLNCTEAELVPIAMMRLDMVTDGCDGYATIGCTDGTKRLDAQLIARAFDPDSKIVPRIPGRVTSRHAYGSGFGETPKPFEADRPRLAGRVFAGPAPLVSLPTTSMPPLSICRRLWHGCLWLRQ